MEFAATNYDAVFFSFYDMEIGIRIGLLARRFGTIAASISHAAVHHQVVFLNIFHVFLKTLVIFGAVGLINLKCCTV
jgi:hypothetical protein